MYNLLENVFMSNELYQTILKPVCDKYKMTYTEMVVLLFLANNPEHDTARDIVERRRLTKSSVSVSVRSLQEKGFVLGEFTGGNHRSIHLRLCEPSKEIIKEGKIAQESFLTILTNGFSEEEKGRLKNYFKRVTANIDDYNRKARRAAFTRENNL